MECELWASKKTNTVSIPQPAAVSNFLAINKNSL